jgi:hypothetical protein
VVVVDSVVVVGAVVVVDSVVVVDWVVVVVDVLVVVVGQGFGSQEPAPRSFPPAAAQAPEVSSSQRSKAPPAELCRQHRTVAGIVVVVVEVLDVLVVELSVVVVVEPSITHRMPSHAKTRLPPFAAHSAGFSSSQVTSALPGVTGTQQGTSTGGWVVVVVDVVVVVVTHGSGSQVPGPMTVPPRDVHSSGFSSSQPRGWSGNAPPGEGGRQHWTSSLVWAGAQPCAAASHQLANGATHAVP